VSAQKTAHALRQWGVAYEESGGDADLKGGGGGGGAGKIH